MGKTHFGSSPEQLFLCYVPVRIWGGILSKMGLIVMMSEERSRLSVPK